MSAACAFALRATLVLAGCAAVAGTPSSAAAPQGQRSKPGAATAGRKPPALPAPPGPNAPVEKAEGRSGETASRLLPPAADMRVAARAYPVTTLALTRHKGWVESVAYVNFPQSVKLSWHVDRGGEAELAARDAWDPEATWRPVREWRGKTEAGETEMPVSAPTVLRLRAKAARWPKSGIARLRASYVRHTVAVLRGAAGAERRPVMLAEGYDPFNTQDWNDPTWQEDPTFARLVAEGRRKFGLDPWLIDWGDAGAPLEQQAEDFADLARQIRAWNGGRAQTVAAGISMGAVSVRYALAAAARTGGLGIRKYVSVNGPHRGAWVSPELREYLLKRAAKEPADEAAEDSEAYLVRRGLDSPAAQELLIDGPRHEAFYAELRKLGKQGYDPAVERVAFSNGTFVREGSELADLVEGKGDTVHRVAVRPLWLPVWVTVHRTRRDFEFGGYPGELLPESLRQPVRDHTRFLGLFRLDLKAQWEAAPTFIPTHSALDFPEDLAGGPPRLKYAHWRETAFPKVYVARGHNLAHDETQVDWIDPRTGKGAPGGENAILYEIRSSFPARGPAR